MPIPHTPGPWAIYDDGSAPESSDVIMARANDENWDVAEISTELPLNERKANARLIAAAPDMLTDLEDGTVAAQAVIDSWESGDLADAVNDLQVWLEQANKTLDNLYEGKQP